MKKLDKLILKSFFGPFFLTFLVVVFILLVQYMLKYFDDFVGKDLGFSVFAELIFYFSINMSQVALPLAILLSSLMTFGNLGEHFELTAIKSAGISLVRTLRPLFIAVLFLVVLAFMNNNFIVPEANINAYSLLYDIRQKKPSLDIREGQFYNGIPNYSIKVNQKFPDGVSMKDVIIYDHTREMGNNSVTVADSCRMYTILNDRYLVFELYDGNSYQESRQNEFNRTASFGGVNDLARNEFSEMKMVLSLASFDLNRTKQELFAGNRLMKDMGELAHDIDSMQGVVSEVRLNLLNNADGMYDYHLKERRQWKIDSIRAATSKERESVAISQGEVKITVEDSILSPNTGNTPAASRIARESAVEALAKTQAKTKEQAKMDSIKAAREAVIKRKKAARDTITFEKYFADNSRRTRAVNDALVKARYIKTNLANQATRIENLNSEIYRHIIEKHKKVALAFSCLVMFFIGAPLGSIIKKGGFGLPVILSIGFFIIFYVVSIMSEKYAREGLLDGAVAAWMPNMILMPFGIFFLRQARNDSRLFDADVYIIFIDRLKKKWASFVQRKSPVPTTEKALSDQSEGE
ncbi:MULTISPECIES: LptF/LptG family permease [unclassified Imperialibacter]|uniref:LptF/LptG family permease n=1 Tax=unclassified Imperialibacter TaxID=2629706 RepID=UPI00125BE743|nr:MULTISPECIES: LptF/LptG family permease [unclassified Imperialibacter]CAD5256893.1 Lipopolysaccharide ABC transporter permease [Imperialibacter sp. 75]CAD5259782.1 Lipopolysaccharide ABC transporter permease [Imperialibacter sp. 89]VVT26089.1 Lipopolysaccharide ABC transporter permease [Imperialibacter sp. EC-SDR9]